MTHDEIVYLNDNKSDRPETSADSSGGVSGPSGEVPQAEIVSGAISGNESLPTARVVGISSSESPHPPTRPTLPKSRFGLWFIAWPVILLLAGFIFAIPYLVSPDEEPIDPSAEISQLEIQGKYLLGLAETTGPMANTSDDILPSLEGLAEGSWESRLCHAILIGEFDSPEAAVDRLADMQTAAEEAGYSATDSQEKLRESLVALYGDYNRQEWTAPSVAEEQRSLLQEKLGWYGELALTPVEGPEDIRRNELVGSAQTLMAVIAVAAASVLLVGTGGFVGSILFVILAILGKIHSALKPKTANGNIYIETFALWFVLFLTISLGIEALQLDLPLVGQSLFTAFSLSALAWPLIRQVSFHDLRRDIGLYAKNPALEVVWGFACYFATLPLMALGMILMLIMMGINASFVEAKPFEYAQGPSHPIGEWLIDADWFSILQIFILAAVMAPIIEEIMFRGVLYRHLRDATARMRIVVSVILSTLVNSLIFAAIHPQGIFGIPLLMSLAIGFSLAREWRGSLIAPITMHAINNGGVTLLAGFMLGGFV